MPRSVAIRGSAKYTQLGNVVADGKVQRAPAAKAKWTLR
jgi:hypothetical protein